MLKIKIKSKKTVLIIAFALIICAVGLFFYFNDGEKPSSTETPKETINFDPPTEEERNAGSTAKDRIVEDAESNNQNQQAPGTKKAVKPVITYSGQYDGNIEVGGYIPSIFEDGGQCTSTFSKNGKTVVKKVSAVKAANSVDCPTMFTKPSEFPEKGNWNLKLSYESASASGASDSKQVEVK